MKLQTFLNFIQANIQKVPLTISRWGCDKHKNIFSPRLCISFCTKFFLKKLLETHFARMQSTSYFISQQDTFGLFFIVSL